MDISEISADARSGNAARLHEATARHHGEALAVEYHGETLTHGELSAESAAFAGALAEHGIEPGEVMLQYLPNCPAYLTGALGAFKAGVAVSPVNPQYRKREVAFVDELPRTASGKLQKYKLREGEDRPDTC
jgi:long-chain acyl-CoA synthetase